MPSYVEDLYQEFKFSEHFSLTVSYDDLPAHKTDWWAAFIRIDNEIKAEQERANRN